MASSDITISVKKYFDGEVPFTEMAQNAGVGANSIADCTPEEKEAIREEVKENYWRYLDELTENENQLIQIQFDGDGVMNPITEVSFGEAEGAA